MKSNFDDSHITNAMNQIYKFVNIASRIFLESESILHPSWIYQLDGA